jgi:hypothetical protein
MPVSIFIRNDFETFKPTNDILIEYPLTSDGLVCPLLAFLALSGVVSWAFSWVVGCLHGFSVGPDNLSQSIAECLLGTEHWIA